MKYVRVLAFAAGSLVAVQAVLAIGCSSTSSTAPGGDSGAGRDATADVGQDAALDARPDAAADVTVDVGPDATVDTGQDVAVDSAPDVVVDTGADAVVDSGINLGDVGVFDGSVVQYAPQVAAAICDRIAECCGTAGDAATFEWNKCMNFYLPFGFAGSNEGAALVDGGSVTVNPSQAQQCLSGIQAIDCTANVITSALAVQLYQTCFGAFTGTLPLAAPCQTTVQCAPGGYCGPQDAGADGAVGTCQALEGAGGPCAQLGPTSYTASQRCVARTSAPVTRDSFATTRTPQGTFSTLRRGPVPRTCHSTPAVRSPWTAQASSATPGRTSR